MLDEYYALRGWNKEGKPTKARFKELGLTGDVEKAVD
jgi:aldehyde:ferredoxin oxidoreductase